MHVPWLKGQKRRDAAGHGPPRHMAGDGPKETQAGDAYQNAFYLWARRQVRERCPLQEMSEHGNILGSRRAKERILGKLCAL
jgi:hypothetical protein